VGVKNALDLGLSSSESIIYAPLMIIVTVSQQSFTYMRFSGAVVIFETKIKILLMHQYPFFKDIAHVLIPHFPLSYVIQKL